MRQRFSLRIINISSEVYQEDVYACLCVCVVVFALSFVFSTMYITVENIVLSLSLSVYHSITIKMSFIYRCTILKLSSLFKWIPVVMVISPAKVKIRTICVSRYTLHIWSQCDKLRFSKKKSIRKCHFVLKDKWVFPGSLHDIPLTEKVNIFENPREVFRTIDLKWKFGVILLN